MKKRLMKLSISDSALEERLRTNGVTQSRKVKLKHTTAAKTDFNKGESKDLLSQ